MALLKPYRRTCRPFVDGSYANGGKSQYILDEKYADEPWHYIHAFLLLQDDIRELFEAVEPADTNQKTYSHKIQQLLMRCCVELEANFTAILLENGYSKKLKDLNAHDYRLIEKSHRLSSYTVMLPGWRGSNNLRQPFQAWANPTSPLSWYQDYNASKHDRHNSFEKASFNSMIDAYCGLAVILAAQFYTYEFSTASSVISWGGGSGYWDKSHQDFEPSIGDFLRIKFPNNWPESERYDFDWKNLSSQTDPFSNFVF